jgi:cytochrome P450
MEMRMILAHLFRRFDFVTPEESKTDMSPASYFILKPRGERLYVRATHNIN